MTLVDKGYVGTSGAAAPAGVGTWFPPKEARREAVNYGCDVLIVDTAGRLHIDENLMQ